MKNNDETIQEIVNNGLIVKGNYDESKIPEWCQMSKGEHLDGVGGCWGLAFDSIKQESDCNLCEYYKGDKNEFAIMNKILDLNSNMEKSDRELFIELFKDVLREIGIYRKSGHSYYLDDESE